MIAKAEGISFEEGVLDTLIKTSDGDLRRAITYLQSASRLHGVDTEKSSAITPKSITEVAGVVPDEVIRGLAKSMGISIRQGEEEDEQMAKQNKKLSGFEQLRAQVRYITREGYSTTQLLIQLHDYIMEHELLIAAKKAKCAIEMGRADKDLTDGGDEELQLLNLCLRMKHSLR